MAADEGDRESRANYRLDTRDVRHRARWNWPPLPGRISALAVPASRDPPIWSRTGRPRVSRHRCPGTRVIPAADPIAVALRVIDALEALGVTSTVGGSIAASFAGEPRSTLDIDVIAAIDEPQIDALVAALSADFYIDPESLRRAIRTKGSTNLIHQATQYKVDVFVAGGTPLDAQQLARRQPVQIGNRTLFVHPPEDILLQKLRWYRAGGGVSDRQWRDVIAIIRTQGARLDRQYLLANAPLIGVEDLPTRAFAES